VSAILSGQFHLKAALVRLSDVAYAGLERFPDDAARLFLGRCDIENVAVFMSDRFEEHYLYLNGAFT
jgi:hypothetical protein